MTTHYHTDPKLSLAQRDAQIQSGEAIIYTDFMSVENRFPLWYGGREVILSNVPKRLSFYIEDRNTLSLDCRWLNNCYDACPWIHKERFAKLTEELAHGIRFDVIGDKFFCALSDELVYYPLTDLSVRAANTRLANENRRRESESLVCVGEYILHVLGITESTLSGRLQGSPRR